VCRKLFIIWSFSSLFLAIGVAVALIRSHWIADEYSYATMNQERLDAPFRMYSLYFDRGRLGGQRLNAQVELRDRGMKEGWKLGWQHDPAEPGDLLPPIKGLGFHAERFDYVEQCAGSIKGVEFQLPLWFLLVMMLLSPTLWVGGWLRRPEVRQAFSMIPIERAKEQAER
jgi:hypothetical protein